MPIMVLKHKYYLFTPLHIYIKHIYFGPDQLFAQCSS